MSRTFVQLWQCAGASPREFVLPGCAPVYEQPRPFVIRHIALELELLVDEQAVAGIATLELERIDASAGELDLDAVGFEIAEVTLSEKTSRPASFAYDGRVLHVAVDAGAQHPTVRVRYRAKPRRGLYFLAPDQHVPDRPHQVWTQCQDEDARYFFPCQDRPNVRMTFELTASVPNGWQCLSNGELVEQSCDAEAPKWTYHWRMDQPLPSYLVTLVAGEFGRIDAGTVDSVPISYWVPKGRERDGQYSFARTPEMIRLFGEKLGVPFPFQKYAQVVVSDFTFGGMENTTATTLHDAVLLDERARIDVTSDDLIAHELAHQWFGDYVTCRDWSHAWLNEGFATFLEHVDREAHLGKDEYQESVRIDRRLYITESKKRYRRPIVCREYENPIDLFDRHLYEKGGLVLHMLRQSLGDEAFWRGVRRYLERHGHGIVETRDLLRALEDASGRSLESFFEQWVQRDGHPELDIKVEYENKILNLRIQQKQLIDKDHRPFAFELAVDVGRANGSTTRHRAWIENASDSVAISCPERPSFVVVDPEMAVLAELTIDAPRDMLESQLSNASTAYARSLAIAPLAKSPDPATLRALATKLGDESEFWGLRAQAAEALGRGALGDAFEILVSHRMTAHPKVRRAVVRALGEFRTPEAARALKPIALKDDSYLVQAEAARSLGNTRQADIAFDTLVEVADRASWADQVRVGALDGMAALRDERCIPHVLARMRYGVSRRARTAAFLALAKLTQARQHREALEDLLNDRDTLMRGAVVRALAEMGDPKSKAALEARLETEEDGRVRRQIREAIRDLDDARADRYRELHDEVDRLKHEQTELAVRLKRLEAVAIEPPRGPAAPSPPSESKRRTSRAPRSTIARRKKRAR